MKSPLSFPRVFGESFVDYYRDLSPEFCIKRVLEYQLPEDCEIEVCYDGFYWANIKRIDRWGEVYFEVEEKLTDIYSDWRYTEQDNEYYFYFHLSLPLEATQL